MQRPGSTITPRLNRSLHRLLTIEVLNVFLYLFLYLVYKSARSGRVRIVLCNSVYVKLLFSLQNDRECHVGSQLKFMFTREQKSRESTIRGKLLISTNHSLHIIFHMLINILTLI